MKKASSLRLLGVLVLLGAIAWAATHRSAFDLAAVQAKVGAMGAIAPLAFVFLYAAAAVLFVPGSALTLAGGALFGPIAGALYSLVGATLGAALAFLLARTLVADWARSRTGARLGELVEGIEREGWRFVAFARLVPLFPYNLLNYALGLTRIPFGQYVVATLVCMTPGAAAYSYLGYAGAELLGGGGREAVKAGLWALALLGLATLLPGFVRRRRGSAATIAARDLERRLEAGESICVLDVRTSEEFHGLLGHVRNAVSIPVDELPARLAELDGWRSRRLVLV